MKKCVTALIKPASSLCDMECTYCFYKDTAKKREQYSYGIMTYEVVDQLIQKTLLFANGGPVTYCFQGGEPLLAGVSFYQYFTKKVKEINSFGSSITYSLQTNGRNLSDEFCQLFQKHSFLLGVSLDGISKVHNKYRCSSKKVEETDVKDGTFEEVMKGIALLKQYQIEFNILSVVTAYSAKYIKETWEFFKEQGFSYLQFINCLEPIGNRRFQTEFVMDNEQYYEFYKQLFDLYYEELKNNRMVSVRYFDNLMARLWGRPVEQCDMLGRCFGQLVVEADGSIYPCDFYCNDRYYLGNILKMSLEELQKSPVMHQFVKESLKIEEDCKRCNVWGLCLGGCRRERDYFSDGILQKNKYCEGRKKFFHYVLQKFKNGV